MTYVSIDGDEFYEASFTRAAQVSELLRSGRLLKAVRWQQLAAGAVVVIAMLAWKASSVHTVGQTVVGIRLACVVAAAAAAFVLDDAALRTVAAVPLAWSVRLALRAALALAYVTILYGLVVGWLAVVGPGMLPADVLAALAVELLALLCIGLLGSAAAMSWFGYCEPGFAVSSGVAIVAVALLTLPSRFEFYAPLGAQWDAAHDRWLVVLVLAVVALLCAGRDPASALSIRRVRRSVVRR